MNAGVHGCMEVARYSVTIRKTRPVAVWWYELVSLKYSTCFGENKNWVVNWYRKKLYFTSIWEDSTVNIYPTREFLARNRQEIVVLGLRPQCGDFSASMLPVARGPYESGCTQISSGTSCRVAVLARSCSSLQQARRGWHSYWARRGSKTKKQRGATSVSSKAVYYQGGFRDK